MREGNQPQLAIPKGCLKPGTEEISILLPRRPRVKENIVLAKSCQEHMDRSLQDCRRSRRGQDACKTLSAGLL